VTSGNGPNPLTSNMAITVMFKYLNIWGVIISVFFGVGAVRSDFHNNIIYQYLTLPISRTTYFLTRIVGTWSMVFAFYLYSYIFTYILFFTLFKTAQLTWGQFGNIFIMGIYTFVYVAMTFIVSMYLNRLGAFISMLFISFLINLSNGIYGQLSFAEYFKDFGLFKFISLIIYIFAPHLANLSDIGNNFLVGDKNPYNIPLELVHFIATTALVLYGANQIIKKKDF
jgi:ABC-type transport system involved in multi-copper enzyme maturation permease subunit